MWEFSVFRSLHLMAQTAPFLLLRLVTCFGIALALNLATGRGWSG